MEEETKKSMIFATMVIGMMWLTSWFASVDAKLYWLLHYIWKMHTFFGLECDQILEFSTLLMDQQSLTNIGLDMLMVMKAWRLHCLWLSSSLSLLSWISYLKSTWALHQIKGGQKHGDAQTCQMWCIGYFSELFENSLRNNNKTLSTVA